MFEVGRRRRRANVWDRQLASKYDGGDHLHPNPDGYVTMANAFNMTIFQ